jgi:putative FmdB family regulatory protein
MPLYEIKCDVCGKQNEIFRHVRDMDDLPECCGVKMHRMLSAPMVIADIQPYRSQKTGEWITSRNKHRNHLKAHGLIEVGTEKMEPPKPSKKDDSLKREIARHLYK